jgi:hypothetical protein
MGHSKTGFYCIVNRDTELQVTHPALMLRMGLLRELRRIRVARVIAERLG